MKNSALANEFIDLIDSYKIAKIDDFVKKVKSDLTKLPIDINEVMYSNALEPIDLQYVQSQFLQMYEYDFSEPFVEWDKFQSSEEYKSQSLKTKITNKVKKEVQNQDTKEDIKKVLDRYKLNYDLNEALQAIKQKLDEESIQIIENKQAEWVPQLDEINEKYNYANWLDWASSNAKNVSFATHIAKLTHSGINGASNIFFNGLGDEAYLSTASLNNKEVEVSQSNNALAPIGKLLQLQSETESLSEQLQNDNLAVFERFAKDDEQLTLWRQGFGAVFKEKELATHYLAKQLYFPINGAAHSDDNNYHLINPMMSSSLDQIMFEKINFAKYSKVMVEIRKQKREGLHHKDIQIAYPNLAILKVTASNHSNPSPLNGKRSGKRYLFPSTPPAWQSIQKPPLKQESLFAGEFDKRAWQAAKELQKYLIKLQSREFGNKAMRAQVKQHINDVINILFDYVLDIQAMQSGWSEKTKLKESHALWLDINRDETTFQEKRKSGQWQVKVCEDFGLWMNSKLSNKEMKLVMFEKNKWAKLLQNRLNLFDKGWESAK